MLGHTEVLGGHTGMVRKQDPSLARGENGVTGHVDEATHLEFYTQCRHSLKTKAQIHINLDLRKTEWFLSSRRNN